MSSFENQNLMWFYYVKNEGRNIKTMTKYRTKYAIKKKNLKNYVYFQSYTVDHDKKNLDA